jgi:nickel transport protein
MTGFRLFLCLSLLLLSCSWVAAEQQYEQLQQENAALKRQVKRLETKVDALHQELSSPDATQVIGGVGYIVGVFGVAAWIAARKQQRQG